MGGDIGALVALLSLIIGLFKPQLVLWWCGGGNRRKSLWVHLLIIFIISWIGSTNMPVSEAVDIEKPVVSEFAILIILFFRYFRLFPPVFSHSGVNSSSQALF